MAALSEEQQMIKDQAVAWVKEQAPLTTFRAMRDQGTELGFFPETWSAMTELGWSGMLVPEAYGGAGLGYQTLGLVLEQLGRNLVPSPLFASSVLGASALMQFGSDEQKQRLLPSIADGSRLMVVAMDEGPRFNPASVATRLVGSPDSLILTGEKCFVMEGMAASDFLVVALIENDAGDPSLGLVRVSADAPGIHRKPVKTMDSRGYANVSFDQVAVNGLDVLTGEGNIEKLFDVAAVTLSAEMLGSAAAAFDMTLEYLKTRKQFGQVIGGFQALGHRAASLYSEMELTRSCVEAALAALDQDREDVTELASLAKGKTSEFLHEMSSQLIQIHGGIGMTDEFDAGFYLKRARVVEAAFGNAAYHRDRFATASGF